MTLRTDQYHLTASIQSDIDWRIHGQPVYGPGSVIQGQVLLQVFDAQWLKSLDQIRLVFHGTERIQDDTNEVLQRRQLFGSQSKLWANKYPLLLNTEYTFPFYIEIPMIQFPPSMDICQYRCLYTISLFLDQSGCHASKPEINCPILLMPLIETSRSKSPICQRQGKFSLSTPSLDYVPNDTIPINFFLSTDQPLSVSGIQLQLQQTIRTTSGAQAQSILASDQWPLSQPPSSIALSLQLLIPDDATPSVSYSDIVTVSYRLLVRIKERRLLGYSFRQLFDLPIHIGTLGYGIRSPQDLQVYSVFRTAFDGQNSTSSDTRPLLPPPFFIREQQSHGDFLPPYDSTRLPSYEKSSCHPLQPTLVS
ncbi:hypothetical protein DM01DRAFT_1381214, partial [Hesseltinella vesiculosa]